MQPLSQHLIKRCCQTKVRHTPPNPFNCGRKNATKQKRVKKLKVHKVTTLRERWR